VPQAARYDGLRHGRDLVEQPVRQAIADGRISPDRNPATALSHQIQ
jgi:hypothetical protein